MTTSEYRQHPACNFSSLKHLLKSPAHYQAALQERVEETPAMRLGTLVHAMVLEDKEPTELYAIKPPGLNLATKEGKEWKAAQTLEIMSYDDLIAALEMKNSIIQNPHAKHALAQCPIRETPIIETIFDVPCKALLDAHGSDGNGAWAILDIKTTDDASPDGFGRKVANYHYDFQASFYSAILAQHHQLETRPFWMWIAVEKTAPYTCAVYAAAEWEESGDLKMERILRDWKTCTESDNWPQPFGGINQLPKPKWA